MHASGMVPRDDLASSTVRTTLFDWLSRTILTARFLGGKGGAIKLISKETGNDVTVIIVDPITSESDVTIKAGEIADSLVAEAEAYCEGGGGGTCIFSVQPHANGTRGPIAERPIKVTLESDGLRTRKEANATGLVADVMEQNRELHNSIVRSHAVSMAALSRTIANQTKMLEHHESVAVDNLVMMKANIENRTGQEAAAFATVRNAQMMDNILGLAATHAIPMLLQNLIPHVAPFLISWATRPENEEIVGKLLTNMATNMANAPANQPHPLMAMMMGAGAGQVLGGGGNGNGSNGQGG